MFTQKDLKVVNEIKKTLQRAVDEGYAEVVSWNQEHPNDIIWANVKFYTQKEIQNSILNVAKITT